MAGTILGVMISGGLAFAIGAKVHLTGLSMRKQFMLMYIPQGIEFNFRGLFILGYTFGCSRSCYGCEYVYCFCC